MFLGLAGIAVKSHGSTDAFGFANAIGVAVDLKLNGFLQKISDEVARLNQVPAAAPSGVVTAVDMKFRSQVAGCGGYLPERIVTNDELASTARHVGCVDPTAHRNRRATHRGDGRTDLGPRLCGGAAGA